MFCNLWALLELTDTVMRGLDFRCSGRAEASYDLEEQSERVSKLICGQDRRLFLRGGEAPGKQP